MYYIVFVNFCCLTIGEPGLVTKTPPSGLRKRQTTTTPSEIVSADHPPPKKRKIGRNDGSGEVYIL